METFFMVMKDQAQSYVSKRHQSEINARLEAASGKLKAQGLIITSLNEAKGGGFDFSAIRSKLGLGGKISLKVLVL
ncbi:MAG: hypothetical protein ABIJ33_04560, partial [Patescibacteria group bacterium]